MTSYGQRATPKQPRSTRAGTLRTPIAIQAQTRTNDAGGGYALDWTTTVYTTLAEKRALSGSERILAMQTVNTAMFRFTLRKPPRIALDETMRLTETQTGAVYNIRDVSDLDQTERWLVLLCEHIPGSSGA